MQCEGPQNQPLHLSLLPLVTVLLLGCLQYPLLVAQGHPQGGCLCACLS